MRKKPKLVYGVGVNDATYQVYHTKVIDGRQKILWTCHFYATWASMLQRCYSDACQAKNPTYAGCSTVPQWHSFLAFREWMCNQDWQEKFLDKDLLKAGNREYGPATCVFVSRAINNFILERKASRSPSHIGGNLHKATGKYMARCRSAETGKTVYLGQFDTPEEAGSAWLEFKRKQARYLAANESDPRIARALIERYENYGKVA